MLGLQHMNMLNPKRIHHIKSLQTADIINDDSFYKNKIISVSVSQT